MFSQGMQSRQVIQDRKMMLDHLYFFVCCCHEKNRDDVLLIQMGAFELCSWDETTAVSVTSLVMTIEKKEAWNLCNLIQHKRAKYTMQTNFMSFGTELTGKIKAKGRRATQRLEKWKENESHRRLRNRQKRVKREGRRCHPWHESRLSLSFSMTVWSLSSLSLSAFLPFKVNRHERRWGADAMIDFLSLSQNSKGIGWRERERREGRTIL